MLKTYSVAFFGHRYVENTFEVSESLQREIRQLLSEKEYIEFLVGKNGEFDTVAASAVRRAKKEYRSDNSSLVLILPYSTAEYENNEESFLKYYDEVEICEDSQNVHYKSAITVRNQKIAERADCIICHIKRENGGAYAAVVYAKKLGKRIIYI